MTQPKLEVGKKYLNRKGEIKTITEENLRADSDSSFRFFDQETTNYRFDGRLYHGREDVADLISEHIEEPMKEEIKPEIGKKYKFMGGIAKIVWETKTAFVAEYEDQLGTFLIEKESLKNMNFIEYREVINKRVHRWVAYNPNAQVVYSACPITDLTDLYTTGFLYKSSDDARRILDEDFTAIKLLEITIRELPDDQN